MSVTIQDNTPKIIAQVRSNGSLAIKRALDDVLRLSRPNTPLADTMFLRNNTQTQTLGLSGVVKWMARYAQYQERGARRDGSHRVRNYTTGGTGSGFAEDAIKQVDKDRAKYLKGIIR